MSHYPAVSHAFVLREVEHLRATGLDVETLSIHRADEADLLSAADRAAAATTTSVLPTSARTLISAHLEALARSPRRYASTLARALRTGTPGLRERLWHAFYFAEAMILLRHCRRAGITHIHAQFADSATDVAMLIAHYRGDACTWSLAVHGSVEFYNVDKYALTDKLQDARFAVGISDFGRSQLMRLSDSSCWDHIHVVRCGVDLTVYEPPAQRPGRADGGEILFVGRLLHGKGLSLLFEAAGELRSRGLDVTVTVIGEGPARPEDAPPWARFLGSIGQDDLLGHYAQADIFCLPSFAEGIPVVAMEAMAMELPVVTTRIMGIPELVEDGAHGLLVAPGRVDALTDALERLVRDPEARRRMGAAGREKIRADYDVVRSAATMRSVLAAEIGA